MGIYLEEKEEKNYQAFMDELEKISKKYGIAFEGCGVFAFSDENGFKSIKYRKELICIFALTIFINELFIA